MSFLGWRFSKFILGSLLGSFLGLSLLKSSDSIWRLSLEFYEHRLEEIRTLVSGSAVYGWRDIGHNLVLEFSKYNHLFRHIISSICDSCI